MKKKDLVLGQIRKHINSNTGELDCTKTQVAEELKELYPESFLTIENARSMVRYATNTMGKRSRIDIGKEESINVTRHIPDILVFDIETLPMQLYSFQVRKPFFTPEHIKKDWCMCSWAAKWLHDGEVFGDVLTPEEARNHDDKRIVMGMWDALDKAEVIVAHNGNRFDCKKVNARFQIHGMRPPSPYKKVDTLLSSYKTTSHTYHKLDYLTKATGQQGKIKTDFQLWIDCDNGVPEALAQMFTYNKRDVTELEEYYLNNLCWIPSHPTAGMYYNGDNKICPACGHEKLKYVGEKVNQVTSYPVFQCEKCGSMGYVSAKGKVISMPSV